MTSLHYYKPDYKCLSQKCEFDKKQKFTDIVLTVNKNSCTFYQYSSTKDIIIGLFDNNDIQVDSISLNKKSNAFTSGGINVKYYKVLGVKE